MGIGLEDDILFSQMSASHHHNKEDTKYNNILHGEHKLESTTTAKYLGVAISNTMNWSHTH